MGIFWQSLEALVLERACMVCITLPLFGLAGSLHSHRYVFFLHEVATERKINDRIMRTDSFI